MLVQLLKGIQGRRKILGGKGNAFLYSFCIIFLFSYIYRLFGPGFSSDDSGDGPGDDSVGGPAGNKRPSYLDQHDPKKKRLKGTSTSRKNVKLPEVSFTPLCSFIIIIDISYYY